MGNIDSLPASSFKAELKKLLAKYNAESYSLAKKSILSIDMMKEYSGIWECYTFSNK